MKSEVCGKKEFGVNSLRGITEKQKNKERQPNVEQCCLLLRHKGASRADVSDLEETGNILVTQIGTLVLSALLSIQVSVLRVAHTHI